MAAPLTQQKSRRLRRALLWFGILLGVIVLAIILFGVYLNRVGVPDFLKRPLVARLKAEGVQIDFARMRLRWYRGLVVDEAKFTFLKPPAHPTFSAATAELNLNYRSLLDSKLKFDAIIIEQGKLTWPASETNQITVSNITTQIRLGPKEFLNVTRFEAEVIGARVTISGNITNALAVRDWEIFQKKKPSEPKQSLARLAQVLEKIKFSGQPQITVTLSGDAAIPQSFQGELEGVVAAVQTPWGTGTNLQLSAFVRDFFNAPENNLIRVRAGFVETPWVSGTNCHATVKLTLARPEENVFQTDLRFSGSQLQTKFGGAEFFRFQGQSSQAWTNLVPTQLSGTVKATQSETKWGEAAEAEITFAAVTNSLPKLADETWAAWSKAEPFHVTWEARASGVESPKIKVQTFFCTGSWVAPELKISALDLQLYDGAAHLSGQLNAATRAVSAKGDSDFDVQKVSPFLSPFGQRWLGKYSWEKPPKLDGSLSVILPAWTNRAPNWREEVLPTFYLDGSATVERATYRGVDATAASATFSYSNMVWTLPHIRVERPEGGVDLNLVSDDRTHAFQWRINSEIAPAAVRHLLEENQQAVFDDFQFSSPPKIRADLVGNWEEADAFSATAEIAVQDFSYHSNAVDKVNCWLQFTNQNLQITEGRLEKGDKFITAKKIELDFPTKKLFFTDVYGTVDGHLVARLIGRKVAAHIEPYQFAEPPAVRVNGSMGFGNDVDADLHFVVDGTQFRWQWFEADQVFAKLDWVGETLLVTNATARAYGGGRLAGWSYFDFAVTNGAEYRFDVAAADVDVRYLTKSLTGKTNRLEGWLHGQLSLDYAHTSSLNTWRGKGRANLRDGLVWDVPVFGLFSPVLNAIAPGSGNSRAREGSATFTVNDGVFNSDNLEIRSATMRLQYRGGVDFEQRIDARVEAQLLRDAWVVGRFLSLALTPLSKIFEYRVTGTLAKPQIEPVYIPDFLMMTLRPFHSIKKALTPDKEIREQVPETPATPP